MAEFEARFSSDDFMEVRDSVSDFSWGFSVERDLQGRRSLSEPASVGWGGQWPDGTLTDEARSFAHRFALGKGAIDP